MRSRDKTDFARLVNNLSGRVYNFAFRLAGNEQDAHDLVQEALEKALAHYSSYDPHRPFESWLFRILQNIYFDSLRRYERKHASSLDAAWFLKAPEAEDPVQILDKKETGELAQEAFKRLPVRYRAVLTLFDIEGYSYKEIAGITSCSVGTVRSRIHRARFLLKEIYAGLRSN